MATFTHSISYDINIPEPDTTMTTIASLSCTSEELRQVNDFLARAQTRVAFGGPFTGEFSGLEHIRGRSLPFNRTDGRIEVRNHALDALPGIINLLGCMCSAVASIGLQGKSWQVNSYFGRQVSYDLVYRPNSRSLDVTQHWDAVSPWGTNIPAPRITLVETRTSTTSSGKTKSSRRSMDVVYMTPADRVLAEHAARRMQPVETHTEPKLKLVNAGMVGEPDYLLPDGRFDPMALAWLLQEKVIRLSRSDLFGSREWRFGFSDDAGTKAPSFHERYTTKLSQSPLGLLAVLGEEDFAIPREWVRPELWDKCDSGPGCLGLPHIFASLGNGLWSVEQRDAVTYDVTIDERLWLGVPDAPTTIGRIIWNMRTYAGYRAPFSVTFETSRSAKSDEPAESGGDLRSDIPDTPAITMLSFDAKPIPRMWGDSTERAFDGGWSLRRNGSFATMETDEAMHALHSEELFVRRLRAQLDALPSSVVVDGGISSTEGAAERWCVRPGEVVQIVALWNSDGAFNGGDVVCLSVYDREGAYLGQAREEIDPDVRTADDFGWREMACLLPHVTAVVTGVDTSSKERPLTLEMRFDPRGTTKDDIVRGALLLMRMPYARRALLSRGPLMASELLLRTDGHGVPRSTLVVPDEPNPAPEGADRPQGTRPQRCENVLAFVGTEDALEPLMQLMCDATLRRLGDARTGHYHDDEELGRASSPRERFESLLDDFADSLPYVLRRKPSGSYCGEKAHVRLTEYGSRLAIVAWYDTFNKPNTDDIAAFLRAMPSGTIGLSRAYMRLDKREAHVLAETFTKGKSNFGQLRRKEKTYVPDKLRQRRKALTSGKPDHLNLAQLAELAMLNEALGNGAHKAFGAERPTEEEAKGPRPRTSQYLDAQGRIDAFEVAHLFAAGIVHLGPDDIAAHQGTHEIRGLRIDRIAPAVAPGFVRHARDYAAGIVDLLGMLEADQTLRVPERRMHRSMRKAVGEGDLTGLTLFNLLGCGRALWIVDRHDSELRETLALRAGINLTHLSKHARDSVYVVLCDDRLLRATPNLYLTIHRLIRAMRKYNGVEGPHVEVIARWKSPDADEYLDDLMGKVSKVELEDLHVEGNVEKLASETTHVE